MEWATRIARNLKTLEERIYGGITPSEAVIAAHAQEHGDWNTWTYTQDKYPCEFGKAGVACGDWWCRY